MEQCASSFEEIVIKPIVEIVIDSLIKTCGSMEEC